MKRACEEIRPDLPLYAEGELRDAPRASRIRLHLEGCPECFEEFEEYGRFTRTILEREYPYCDSLDFSERVIGDVLRQAAGRRRMLFWRRAASFLLVPGLLVGLGFLAGKWWGESPPPDMVASNDLKLPILEPGGQAIPVAVYVRDRDGGAFPPSSPRGDGRVSAVAPGLSEAWWVIGPEDGEPTGTMERELEILLYSVFPREAAPPERLVDCLQWRATLGPSTSWRPGNGRSYRLLLVPEEGEAREVFAIDPVSLPRRVAAGDVATREWALLRSPPRRYRVWLQEVYGLPEPRLLPAGERSPWESLLSPARPLSESWLDRY